jgi:hypothetical protein
MGQVIQLFRKKLTAFESDRMKHRAQNNLKQDIARLQHTTDTYEELARTLANPRDRFVARQMADECQEDLDKLVAEYTGSYGPLVGIP